MTITLLIMTLAFMFLGLQLQLTYSQQFPIPRPNGSTLAPLSPLDSKVTIGGKSYDSPQALMEHVIKEAQEPGALDKMIDECNILDPDTDIEEGKEMLECQERIVNESKESSP